MGVSCEDYNQCQLTQPDLTPHTVRRNIFPWRAHTHIQTRICTHSLSQSVSLSPRLSPSHTHTFSPSFFISLSFTHTHIHRWMLGAITVSDQAHRHQYGGETGQRDCHSTFNVLSVYCSRPTRGWQDLCLSL